MGMLVVGISDLKVALSPDTLITYALGSCVGICLWDQIAGVAGLSHIMLPSAQVSPGDKNIYKFADTAIPELVRAMEQKGALRIRMKAKIAGGAHMFEIQNSKGNPTWNIGQRNVDAVTEALGKCVIPIVAQDVLQNYGRTISFDPATGIMTIKAVNKAIKTI